MFQLWVHGIGIDRRTGDREVAGSTLTSALSSIRPGQAAHARN